MRDVKPQNSLQRRQNSRHVCNHTVTTVTESLKSHLLSCCFFQNGWKEMVPLTLLLIQCLPTSVIATLWCSHSWWAFFNKNILLCGHNVHLQLRDVQVGLTSGQAWRTDWLMQDGSVSSPHFKQQKPFRINFKAHFKLNRNSHFLCSVTRSFVWYWNLIFCS